MVSQSTNLDLNVTESTPSLNLTQSNVIKIDKLNSHSKHVKLIKQSNVDTTIGNNQTNSHNPDEVVITESIKDILLMVLFFGGLISPIPTGALIDKHGPKLIVTIFILANTIAMLLFPLVHSWSIYLAAGLIFINGAVTCPIVCLSVVISHWFPRYEMTLSFSYVSACSMIAVLTVNPLAGYLCTLYLYFVGGWPLNFYLLVAYNLVIIVLWITLISNDPADHPLITSAEKELILTERNPIDEFNEKSPPYGKIFTCVPVLALLLAHFCYAWFYTLVANQVPDYFITVLKISISEDGFFSGLPYIGSALSLTCFSYAIDRLCANGKFSTTAIRKMCADIGFILAPTFLIVSTLFGRRVLPVITCVCLANAMAAAQIAAIMSAHIDLSPSYVASLSGIIESVESASGMAMNQASLYLIGDEPTLHHWSNLFLATAVVCLIGTHYYALLGSSKLQPWDPTYKSEEKAIEYDQNGRMSLATIYDPEIFIVDARSGFIVRRHSIADYNIDTTNYH